MSELGDCGLSAHFSGFKVANNIRFIHGIYHVNMFKYVLQPTTELIVERLRSSAAAAHKYFIY